MGRDTPTGTGRRFPHIELRLAGQFVVRKDGTELPDGHVGSRKSRTLLKLLAVERPALVSVDKIVAALWAGQPPAAAEQNVASLVSRLRGVLGAEVIRGGRPGYRLADGSDVSVDLDVAARYCDQAEHRLSGAAAVALAGAERAIELLAGEVALADEPYAAWAQPARDELRELLRRARLVAAEAALSTGDGRGAARHAQAAVAADPLDEAAHRWFMSASAAAGEPARALAAYAALRERLADELGVDPAPETQQLHMAILREQDGGMPAPGRGGPAGSGPKSPGRAGSAALALAGRANELATLRRLWSAAAAAQAAVAVIAGEAGIGKTSLAEALAAEAAQDGATVLRARCYEAERSLFLQPIVEALLPAIGAMPAGVLREILGEHAPAAAALLPDVATLLGPQPVWRTSAEMERRRAFEAVTALVRGMAARNPVLLVVDDLQYAGQSSVELIHYLGRHAASSRLLVVATVRAEHDAQLAAALTPVATRVEVGPLRRADVEQLAGEAGHGELADRILQRTRGHTLFVVEVLRALTAGDVGLPESLLSAVQARVQRVGAGVERLLRAAAVLGAVVDPPAVAALLDLAQPAALDLCNLALEARLLVVSGRQYEFANDLIREALYATTPEPSRLAYHRRAADLLTGQPESLARHATAAGDWRRAGRAWLIAAEAAMGRFAASDAVVLASQALGAARRSSDTEVSARAQVVRGRAHEAGGAYEEALADFTQGAADARASADRRLEMLVLRELGGDVPVSVGLPLSYCDSHLADGLRIAESLSDRASEADLLSRLAIIATHRLRLDDALDLGVRAAAAGRAAADDKALALGLDGLKTAYLCRGDAGSLAGVLTELTPLLRRRGDLFRLQWAEFEWAFPAIAAADWDRAVTAIETAIEVNRRGGYPPSAAWYVAHLGWLARLRGRDAEAVTLGRRALTLAEDHPWWRPAACAMLGGSLLVTGDEAGAVAMFEAGLARAEDGGEAYRLRCAAPLAEVTGSAELLDLAAGLLDQARTSDGGWVLGEDAYLAVARAWLARGDPERARAALAPLLAAARQVPWTATLAAALAVDGRALARLGDGERAGAALREAELLARQHGLPHVLADARAARLDRV